MVVLEAFAHGKAVIASRIGGIPELIDEGGNGFLFEPGNSTDLRKKMEYLLENPSRGIRMGKNARSKVQKKFNRRLYYERLRKVYEEALN